MPAISPHVVRNIERNEKHKCINPSSKVLALPLTVGLGHTLKLVLLLDGVAAQRQKQAGQDSESGPA